jgi:hypothetical protein
MRIAGQYQRGAYDGGRVDEVYAGRLKRQY